MYNLYNPHNYKFYQKDPRNVGYTKIKDGYYFLVPKAIHLFFICPRIEEALEDLGYDWGYNHITHHNKINTDCFIAIKEIIEQCIQSHWVNPEPCQTLITYLLSDKRLAERGLFHNERIQIESTLTNPFFRHLTQPDVKSLIQHSAILTPPPATATQAPSENIQPFIVYHV